MHNKDLKDKFIDTRARDKKTRERLRSLLYAVGRFEDEWGADICTRSVDEIKPVIAKIIGVRNYTHTTDLSILRRYARWCLENEVPGATDSLLQIKDVGYEKLISCMVSSPKHLHDRLDLAFPPESDCRIDNVHRCFFWMAFSGLNESETVMVTAKDVDLKSMVIRVNGHEYPIYREAVPVFRHLVTANCFMHDHGTYEKIVARTSGDSILRGVRDGVDLTYERVRRAASRKVKTAFNQSADDISITYTKTWLSGMFYRTYLKETASGSYDFNDAVELYLKDKSNVSRDRREAVASEYEADYSRWKAAFAL